MLKAGIVGLPNVGKSTLFNALSNNETAQAANYPFCTIEPNKANVLVPDKRLNVLQELTGTNTVIPAMVEFVDIAGLVKGASKGEGLGNKFLSNIRETDLIVQVVRCFEDENVIHVSGQVNPIEDIELINMELALADYEVIKGSKEKLRKRINAGDKEAKLIVQTIEKLSPLLEEGQAARKANLSEEEKFAIKSYGLITLKDIIYACNISESDMANGSNSFVDKVKEYAAQENAGTVTICAAGEAELIGMKEDEKIEFLSELGVTELGLNKLINEVYKLLGLQTYFTAGIKEVRAWTINIGDKAPAAAGKIHTDFERGFIKAEVIAYDDYTNCKTRVEARAQGKARDEGKEYIVQDGDVIEFKFNV